MLKSMFFSERAGKDAQASSCYDGDFPLGPGEMRERHRESGEVGGTRQKKQQKKKTSVILKWNFSIISQTFQCREGEHTHTHTHSVRLGI